MKEKDKVKAQSWLDRAITFVSPTAGRRRFANRVALDAALRSYEAAESSRLRNGRALDGRSKDQINYASIDKLRYRARMLDENHDLAKSVLNTLVGHVVGTGITTIPAAKKEDGELAEEFNDLIRILWEDWIRRPEVTWEYDWAKVQRMMARTWMRDGEIFSQLVQGNVAALDHGTEVSLSLELIEADLCPVGLMDKDRGIVQGVEKNTWGRPRSYWMYKEYPTEGPFNSTLSLPTIGMIGFDRKNLKQILAANMVHLKMTERVRETRGVSIFASVMNRLDDLKDYEESERIAARVGAAFALAITKSIDAEGAGASTAEWREMDLAPGIIADNLQPGEKIETIKNDRPSNALSDFRASQLRAIAGGTQSGYSSVSKDYDGSYSSQRQELMEQNNIYEGLRNEFVSMAIEPIYRRFVEMVVLQGLANFTEVDPRTIFDAAHLGRGVPYIEPKKEVDADVAAIQAGLTSRHAVIQKRGGDPNEVDKQLVKERQYEADEELVLSSDFAHSSAGAGMDSDDGGEGGQQFDEDGNPVESDDAEDNAAEEEERRVRQGRRGRRGPRGKMPSHEVEGNRIRFELPDGGWGEWITLTEEKTNGT